MLWIAALAVVAVAVGVVVMALRSDGDTSGPGGASPTGSMCPPDFPVKGNESQSGELIYHEPGWTYYDKTNPERCFVDGRAAEAVGFRASEIR